MNTSTYFFLFFSLIVHAVVFTPLGLILTNDSEHQSVHFTGGKSSFQVILTARGTPTRPGSSSSGKKSPVKSQQILAQKKEVGVKSKSDKLALTPPEYPEESRLYGEEGEVIVSVQTDEEGRTKRVELISSSGYERLDQSVIKKVSETVFSNKQAQELELSFKFELQN